MKAGIRKVARKAINSVLDIAGFELVRRNAPYTDYKAYIPFQETLLGAERAGMSIGDYIDATYGTPGSTQETIDQMAAFGVFKTNIDRVCEIGPGSGRYLDKVIRICNPSFYEIYETTEEWTKWLTQSYNVIAQPTDGMSLAATPSASIDLVHAHKVLPGQPSLTMCRYFLEMARVVRPGGKIVFDIVTEDCLTDDLLQAWLVSHSAYQHYPCLMPKLYAVDFFCRQGFAYDGTFLIPLKPGMTNYLVFTKSLPPSSP